MSTATNTRPASVSLPGLATVTRARIRAELLGFFREREAVVFILLFPVILLVIFGAVFGGGDNEAAPGVSFIQYFVAGMIAAGLLSASFQNLAIEIPIERDSGYLKRLAGTPMPKTAYFLAKVVLVGFISVIQIVLLIALGIVLYGVTLPTSASVWLTFGWVALLGITSCTLLGVAFSSVPKNGKSAPAIVTPIAIVLQFISGVFFVFTELPGWMQTIGAIFPLKWMAQGMRSVFLPEQAALAEPAGSWELGRIALVLTAWSVVGLALCLLTFRWRSRSDG